MSDKPLDPRLDKMVALLYGELSEDEAQKLRQMMDEDPELRSEWDELSSTRQMMDGWEIEESTPSFVLMDPEPARATGATGLWGRLRAGVRRYSMAAGWAVAAAAVVLLIVVLSEVKIDLLPKGVAIQLGSPENQQQAESFIAEGTGEGTPLESPERSDGVIQMISDRGDPVSREEFHTYQDRMSKVMGELLQNNEFNRKQTEDFSGFVRALYEGLNERQSKDYYDLRARIAALRLGLNDTGLSAGSEDVLGGEGLLDDGAIQSLTPGSQMPRDQRDAMEVGNDQ